MRKQSIIAAAAACIVLVSSNSRADVKPHALIGEHMVLQQKVRVPLWGGADEGEKVTISFQGQEASAVTKDGKWLVHLDKLRPGGPYPMTITGKNTLTLKNVLVGEVWLAGGQS